MDLAKLLMRALMSRKLPSIPNPDGHSLHVIIPFSDFSEIPDELRMLAKWIHLALLRVHPATPNTAFDAIALAQDRFLKATAKPDEAAGA